MGPKPRSLVDRFWDKFERPAEGCWNWMASCYTNGYGKIGYGPACRSHISVHRLAWMLWNGPIPDGLDVLHTCDNRKCVRPDHLFLGTQKDNMQDMYNKGRAIVPDRRGSHNGRAKLTALDVVEIRILYATGYYSHQDLAHRYGVGRSTIGHVINNYTWRV